MNASLVLLDETLNYLNGNEMDRLAVMGAMMEQEAIQFSSFTEDVDVVLNEMKVRRKFNAKEFKEKVATAIKTVIDKIKAFIKWVKDKVTGFFKAIVKKIKSKKSLKQLYSEYKAKKRSTNESSFIYEAEDNVEAFLNQKCHTIKDFTPDDMGKKIDEFMSMKKNFTLSKGANFAFSYPYPSDYEDINDDKFITYKEFIDKDIQSQINKLDTKIDNLLKSISDDEKMISTMEQEAKGLRSMMKENEDTMSDEEYDEVFDKWDHLKSEVTYAQSMIGYEKDLYSRLKKILEYAFRDIGAIEAKLS